ncbi:LysR family transcriptional regulator [Acidovorax sp. SUPP2825]|uniref:LysR family transcriptional regulator n=1 Tax=Acidovorax sp. SUPP2825 TaxID=2920879 RepID=UPI0023DE3B75|nr:LysR family transcriptional regulator [Acidovorax sp. SUPP2825]GKS96007.1 LysR family transcriptional regulator [Acidovorax sp. SUPP2825]
MQLKWLEDFIVLAQERSYTRAAELRHVTHPAFGRRIRALEAWAGTPLVEPGSGPVRLTAAGQVFLDTAEQMARTVTLTTGRTLARTVVADLLVRLRPVMKDCELCILTRALADTVALLERGEADFSIAYHHPALAIRLDARQFSHITLASDRLVPVSRATAQGAALHPLAGAGPIPYLAYARTLALGRLVEDQLAHHPVTQRLQRTVECDSADAQYEYVHKGLGVAWLPWSMVHADCKAGRLAKAGDRSMEAKFDVRLYRPKRRLSTQAEAIWRAIATR